MLPTFSKMHPPGSKKAVGEKNLRNKTKLLHYWSEEIGQLAKKKVFEVN
jgi:hypothetical protein